MSRNQNFGLGSASQAGRALVRGARAGTFGVRCGNAYIPRKRTSIDACMEEEDLNGTAETPLEPYEGDENRERERERAC